MTVGKCGQRAGESRLFSHCAAVPEGCVERVLASRCVPGLCLAVEKEGHGQMWRFCRLADVRGQGTMLNVNTNQYAAFFSRVHRVAGQSELWVDYWGV